MDTGVLLALARKVIDPVEETVQSATAESLERQNRFVADLMWSQEPYRVRRRAGVPVYLVIPDQRPEGT